MSLFSYIYCSIKRKTHNNNQNINDIYRDFYQFPRTRSSQNENETRISSWAKFKLLLWKNWKLQLRHPIQTVLEIFAPVAFSILLVIIRSLVDPESFPEPTYYKPFDPAAIPKFPPKMKMSAESL